MEKTIQLKASNRQLNSFEEAVEFCHNYKDSIHSNNIEPLDDDIRIITVIQHEEFDSAINFPFMKKKFDLKINLQRNVPRHTVKKKYRSINVRRR